MSPRNDEPRTRGNKLALAGTIIAIIILGVLVATGKSHDLFPEPSPTSTSSK